MKLVPVVPSTWIGCDAGAAPPIKKLKLSVDGLAVRLGPVTMSWTGMIAGLPAAPGDVTVTVPLKVPGVVSPLVLTEMLTVDGTVPLLGVAESQLPPAADVVKLIPDVPPILTGWAAGWDPPIE